MVGGPFLFRNFAIKLRSMELRLVNQFKSILGFVRSENKVDNENSFIRELQNLKQNVLLDNDTKIVNEAENCLIANCYRAAYIMGWVAIIENLKYKISKMADIGVSKAKKIDDEIVKLEKDNKSTDVFIKDKIIELNLLDSSDKAKLDFFWHQRCIFVHPYNHEPRKDEVENLIREVYFLCMHRDVYFTKDMIDELKEDLITIKHILPKERQKSKIFSQSIIDRIPEIHHEYAYKSLLYSFSLHFDKYNDFKETIKIRDFIIYLLEKNINKLKATSWMFEDRIKKFPEPTIISSINEKIWYGIDDEIKEMIIRYLENNSVIQKALIFRTLSFILKDTSYSQRYITEVQKLDFHLQSRILDTSSVYLVLEKKLLTNHFSQQNEALYFIDTVEGLEYISKLTNEQQFQIMYLIGLCIRNYKANNYINKIRNSNNSLHKFGILLSTIKSSKNYIWFKKDYYFEVLTSIDETENIHHLNYLVQELEQDKEYNNFKPDFNFDLQLPVGSDSNHHFIHARIFKILESLTVKV